LGTVAVLMAPEAPVELEDGSGIVYAGSFSFYEIANHSSDGRRTPRQYPLRLDPEYLEALARGFKNHEGPHLVVELKPEFVYYKITVPHRPGQRRRTADSQAKQRRDVICGVIARLFVDWDVLNDWTDADIERQEPPEGTLRTQLVFVELKPEPSTPRPPAASG
jgi:hypothetical protein